MKPKRQAPSVNGVIRRIVVTHAAANWLRAQAVECAVLESTANFHHLFYHAFRKQELNAHILNPMTIKALLAVEGKSDKADAINMARLAAHFRLRTSKMPDVMQREIRINLRKWDADKAARTRASNSLRSLLTAYRIPTFRRVKPTSASGRTHRDKPRVKQAKPFAWASAVPGVCLQSPSGSHVYNSTSSIRLCIKHNLAPLLRDWEFRL